MIPYHPLAELFPLIEGAEFDALVADIKDNGLREPIVMLEETVLDGRNRLRACDASGVQPRFVQFDGDDPLRYVISKNLRRRHLRDSQRALIAARIANLPWGANQGGKPVGAVTQSEAAQLLAVRERTLRWGRTVCRSAVPEIVALVEVGALSVSAAGQVAGAFSHPKQKSLARAGVPAIVAAARKARSKQGRQGRSEYSILWSCVDAICEALEARRLDRADIAASDLRRHIARVAADRRQP